MSLHALLERIQRSNHNSGQGYHQISPDFIEVPTTHNTARGYHRISPDFIEIPKGTHRTLQHNCTSISLCMADVVFVQ